MRSLDPRFWVFHNVVLLETISDVLRTFAMNFMDTLYQCPYHLSFEFCILFMLLKSL